MRIERKFRDFKLRIIDIYIGYVSEYRQRDFSDAQIKLRALSKLHFFSRNLI